MKYKIDLSTPLFNPLGESMTVSPTDNSPMTLRLALQDGLSKSSTEFPMKVWGWLCELKTSENLVVDLEDKAKLAEVVNKFQVFDFAKAQILVAIESGSKV